MKKTLKNSQMTEMYVQLQPILAYRNKIGYVAARNARILSTTLTEYETIRRALIEKYGEPDLDEQGNDVGTISLKIGSENFKRFLDEMKPFEDIEHEVELMTAKFEEAIGCLSGEEILAVDWMLED